MGAGVPVDPQDGRNIEIVATGLPFHQGIPVAVDATMVSPLRANGLPRPHADVRGGTALGRARGAKERAYPELAELPCFRRAAAWAAGCFFEGLLRIGSALQLCLAH